MGYEDEDQSRFVRKMIAGVLIDVYNIIIHAHLQREFAVICISRGEIVLV